MYRHSALQCVLCPCTTFDKCTFSFMYKCSQFVSVLWWATIRCCIHTDLVYSWTRIHGGFNHATPVLPLFRSCGHDSCMLITPSLLLSDLVDLFILLACEVCSFRFAFDHGYGPANFEILFSFFTLCSSFVTFFIKGIVQPKFHHLPTLKFLPKKVKNLPRNKVT